LNFQTLAAILERTPATTLLTGGFGREIDRVRKKGGNDCDALAGISAESFETIRYPPSSGSETAVTVRGRIQGCASRSIGVAMVGFSSG
jgi:hypothetical protein